MSDVLEYTFEFWSIAERIRVQIPVSEARSEELVFLDFCSQRFSSLELCWLEYRALAPHRGAYFPASERAWFDRDIAAHRLANPPEPPPPNVAVSPIPADELKARELAKQRRAKTTAAQQVVGAIGSVLSEVVPRIEAIAFKSQAGMEALRVASSLEPVSGEESKSGRRGKRKLSFGQSMPSAPTVRKQRQQSLAELKARDDIQYFVRSDADEIELVAHLPADIAKLSGMVFDLHAQLRLVLELDRKTGQLNEHRPRSGTSRFELLLGQDGITPAIEHVLCVAVRVLDRQRVLWKRGYSRMIRLLVAWLPESGVRDVACARNTALSKLINERFVFDGLTISVALRHLSMDHLAGSIELAVHHDCAICLCPADQFADFARSPRPELSVQQIGELYFGSLVDLALHARQRKAAGEAPNVDEYTQFMRSSVEKHSVHSFPALFVGNSMSHIGLMRVAARKLELSDRLSSLSMADAKRVQTLFVEAIELDAQLKQRDVITKNAAPGFDLSAVRFCVPQLHCLAVGKALIHLAMVNPNENSSKAAVERAVLKAAGGKLQSIDNHAYAYNTRNVFFNAPTAFAGCLRSILQANVFLARVFCLPRMRQLSALQRCMLAFVGLAVDPIVSLLLRLKTVNSKEAHSTLRQPSRYKHSLAHVSLDPAVEQTEEGLEHWVGERKAHLSKRGAHNHGDIVREAVADERSARARADYGLQERRQPTEAAPPSQCYPNGIVVCGNALRNVNIRGAYYAARNRVPAELRPFFVELPSHWLITARSAADVAKMDLSQLRAEHDVLCLCDCSHCEHA